MEFKKIVPVAPKKAKVPFFAAARIFLVGAVIGVVITLASGAYWYFSQPKQQTSKVQEWVLKHPKEAEWAMNRYERFIESAAKAYMQNDDLLVDQSK